MLTTHHDDDDVDDDMQGDRSRGEDRQSWHSKVKPVILNAYDDYDDDDDDDDYDYDYDYAFFKCSSNLSFSPFLAAEPPHPRITLDLPLLRELSYLLCQLCNQYSYHYCIRLY